MPTRRDSPASRAVEFLKGRPDGATIGQLATALDMHPSLLKSRLDMRVAASAGDLRREGNRWHYVPPAGMTGGQVKQRPPAIPRNARSGSGQVAAMREHVAHGEYRQARPLLRDDADQFRAWPTRVGDQLIPYTK